MNPLSRAMKMVCLATTRAATQETAYTLFQPSELLQVVRSSTPIPNDETELVDNTLNDISYSELVVFNDANDVMTDHSLNESMLYCYLPMKDSILNRGNIVANVSLESVPTDLALLDGASNVLGPVQAVSVNETIPQEIQESTDIVDLDKQGSIDTNCGNQIEFRPMVECQQASGSCYEPTAFDARANKDVEAQHDSSSIDELPLQEAVVRDHLSTEPGISAAAADDVQTTIGLAGGEEEVHVASTDANTMPQDNVEVAQAQEYPNDTNVTRETPEDVTPSSKKRKADKDSWKKNINKTKRAKGEAYLGRTYEKDGSSRYRISEKPAKELKERCNCKTVGVKCSDVTEEARQKIHRDVWAMSWPQRHVLVKTLVHKVHVGRHRVEQTESSRSNTLRYNLNIETGLVQVCKQMFINTTGITQHMIKAQVCNDKDTQDQQPKSKEVTSNRMSIRAFLNCLPTVPSHYCRKSSTKKYLEPLFNSKAEVHVEYKKWCGDRQLTTSSRQVFSDEFDEGNYALFQPRKDQCDLCVSYNEGNVDEPTYVLHRQRKEQAQKAKEVDKKAAIESNGTIKMLTVDLQSVLLAPSLKASALYYRTKLCVHNYTIYDAATKDVTCYVWHEVEGGLTANEFASCLCHHLGKDRTCKDYIIFSDGSPYQNRNATLSKALTLTAQRSNITITQKFLEKGHTQMEVDSVHSTIEGKLRHKVIYCPSDYVRYMKRQDRNRVHTRLSI